MGAAIELLLHRVDDLRMAVAEQQRAVTAEIVNIAIALDVPFPRSLGPGDIKPVPNDQPPTGPPMVPFHRYPFCVCR
jgi:hypothetical protein